MLPNKLQDIRVWNSGNVFLTKHIKPWDLIEFIIQNIKEYYWGFKEFCNDLILAIYACMHEQGTETTEHYKTILTFSEIKKTISIT